MIGVQCTNRHTVSWVRINMLWMNLRASFIHIFHYRVSFNTTVVVYKGFQNRTCPTFCAIVYIVRRGLTSSCFHYSLNQEVVTVALLVSRSIEVLHVVSSWFLLPDDQYLKLKCFNFDLGCAPDPTRVTHSAPSTRRLDLTAREENGQEGEWEDRREEKGVGKGGWKGKGRGVKGMGR